MPKVMIGYGDSWGRLMSRHAKLAVSAKSCIATSLFGPSVYSISHVDSLLEVYVVSILISLELGTLSRGPMRIPSGLKNIQIVVLR